MKYLFIIILFVTLADSQNRFLLHVNPRGGQEAMPMRPNERTSDAVLRFGASPGKRQMTLYRDSLKFFSVSKDLSYEFGNLEEEMMMTWFLPYGNGFVREVLWAIAGDIGGTKEVNIRAWYPNPRLKDIPSTQHQKNMGYYKKDDDPVNLVTPFRELATDSAWVFPLKSSDSVVYAFDPLGIEATWKKGGVNVPVQAYSWHSLDLLASGDTMKFQEDQLIGFTVLNTDKGSAGIRQEVASMPNPEHPFHSYKFYPRGRLSSIDRGWWLRGDFEWGIYIVVDYTSVPKPKIITKKLLNTASTAMRPMSATVKTQSETDTVTVLLFSKVNAGNWQSTPMVRQSGFTFTGSIPGAQPGDSVFYYITATDNQQRSTRSPIYDYQIFQKKKPLLLLFNGKSLPSGIVDPTIYLKFTMKTDFGQAPYYDFCDIRYYALNDIHALMDLYNAILEVTGDGGANDLIHYSGEWLQHSASLPAGQKRYYLFADQDHGFISNYMDTTFADTDPHVKFFGVKGIKNQDFPKMQNVMKEVTFPWQLSVTGQISSDIIFGFLPGALAKDTVTLWYHPYYEVPLFTNRMDELQPASNGTVLFSDFKSGKPVGVKATDPNNKWQAYYLAFDWMALDVRSDTSSVLYEYPFLDPKYKWIVDIQNIGKTMASLAVPTSAGTDHALPSAFALDQNYPNPFNPATTFSFQLPSAQFVSLTLYDILGKEVKRVLNQEMVPGRHTISWNASGMPSGIYFYRLTAGGFTQTRKLMLLK
jgi:hypothetical protein